MVKGKSRTSSKTLKKPARAARPNRPKAARSTKAAVKTTRKKSSQSRAMILVPAITQQAVAEFGHRYLELLEEIKTRVREAQLKASLAVNSELVLLYWEIGREILSRQESEGWGTKVVARLSEDLHRAFSEMQGFSPRNLVYMRTFAAAYPDLSITQQLVAKLPWGQNIVLLDKLSAPEHRLWYAQQTIEHGWSRAVLTHHIETHLHRRVGRSVNNFARTLPPAQSDLARQLIKDPYNFDFLTLRHDAQERDLESGLLEHVRKFLLELGAGFAFVGQQVPLQVGGEDFFIDLLFYHLRLRSYLVIDLKIEEFRPEHAGKMNFYLSAVDDLLRHDDDRPSIGLILCKTHNKVIAEYALRDVSKPVGVAGYLTKLRVGLPNALKSELPSTAILEAELGRLEDLPIDRASTLTARSRSAKRIKQPRRKLGRNSR